ncbi:uncharacterized protein [Diadema setosum]|uniref:uncharacterized protein n=1 Tax=Diadema setosum TaxID=31175 RepID=UPI003B3B5AC7
MKNSCWYSGLDTRAQSSKNDLYRHVKLYQHIMADISRLCPLLAKNTTNPEETMLCYRSLLDVFNESSIERSREAARLILAIGEPNVLRALKRRYTEQGTTPDSFSCQASTSRQSCQLLGKVKSPSASPKRAPINSSTIRGCRNWLTSGPTVGKGSTEPGRYFVDDNTRVPSTSGDSGVSISSTNTASNCNNSNIEATSSSGNAQCSRTINPTLSEVSTFSDHAGINMISQHVINHGNSNPDSHLKKKDLNVSPPKKVDMEPKVKGTPSDMVAEKKQGAVNKDMSSRIPEPLQCMTSDAIRRVPGLTCSQPRSLLEPVSSSTCLYNEVYLDRHDSTICLPTVMPKDPDATQIPNQKFFPELTLVRCDESPIVHVYEKSSGTVYPAGTPHIITLCNTSTPVAMLQQPTIVPMTTQSATSEDIVKITREILDDLQVVRQHRRSCFADGNALVEVRPRSLPAAPTMIATQSPSGEFHVPMDIGSNRRAVLAIKALKCTGANNVALFSS